MEWRYSIHHYKLHHILMSLLIGFLAVAHSLNQWKFLIWHEGDLMRSRNVFSLKSDLFSGPGAYTTRFAFLILHSCGWIIDEHGFALLRDAISLHLCKLVYFISKLIFNFERFCKIDLVDSVVFNINDKNQFWQ